LAQRPADVKAIFSRCDEEVLQHAWALLDPIQRGALLLTRVFRGSSIILDNSSYADPADFAGSGEDFDQSP
jgi:hypothetical protein